MNFLRFRFEVQFTESVCDRVEEVVGSWSTRSSLDTSLALDLAPRTLLPYNALQLRYLLLRPLSGSSSPCPCLVASLPVRSTSSSGSNPESTASKRVEDLTRNESKPTIEILRILDPEQREPFISLGRIFLACGITPVEGLLSFKLERPNFDCTLSGITPFYDIWVSLKIAREIAKELQVLDELAGLLEWETRKAWSVEDKEEGGLVHNWKIASDRIAPQEYSTQQMLSVSFPRVHLLPSGSQVRTLLPPSATFKSYNSSPPTDSAISYDTLWVKLTEWSVSEYEKWLEFSSSSEENHPTQSSSSSSSSDPPDSTSWDLPDSASTNDSSERNPHDEPSLTPLFLFSTLSPLISLSNLLPPTSSTSTSSNQANHLEDIVLSRSELLPSTSNTADNTGLETIVRSKGSLYLVDAISRLALDTYRRTGSNEGGGREGNSATENKRDSDWRKRLEERIENLEGKTSAEAGEVQREELSTEEGEVESLSTLREELQSVKERIRKLENEGGSVTGNGTGLKPRVEGNKDNEDVSSGAGAEIGHGGKQAGRGANDVRLGIKELKSAIDYAFVRLLLVSVGALVFVYWFR